MGTIRGLLFVAAAAGMSVNPACGDSGGFDARDAGTGTDTDTDGDSDAGAPPDCGDVWYDSASGVYWALLPSGDSTMTWQSAVDYCGVLTLCDHGDWRLPTLGELRSLVRGCDVTVTGGTCEVTDDCHTADCWNSNCDGCAFDEGPDDGCYRPAEIEGSCVAAWSSTDDGESATSAWEVTFRAGGVVSEIMTHQDAGARCVHGGP
jgi:hypothetical protein